MSETLNTILIWAAFSLPIWLSPILLKVWPAWTRRPWFHFIVVNVIVFPLTYTLGGGYGLAAFLFLAWPVLIIGLLVSAMTLFRDSPKGHPTEK